MVLNITARLLETAAVRTYPQCVTFLINQNYIEFAVSK
jgi:hypothetical protein